jgi:tetratricopeptide (TPR) repeat protein
MSAPVNRQQRRRAASLGTTASLSFGGPPADARTHLDRAAEARDRGDLNGALQFCREAARLEPANPEIPFTAATVFETGRDLVNAVNAYRQVLKLKPKFLPALVNCAACLADLGELPESLEAYQAALDIDPTSLVVRQNLAQTLLRLRRPADAVAHLRMVAETRQGALDHSALADALDLAGDREGALASYAEAIRRGAPAAPVRVLMAGIELVRGDRAAARIHLDAALASDPHNEHVHLVLANNFADKESLEERIRWAETALSRSRGKPGQPGSAPLHFALGRLHDRAGRYDDAYGHFEAGNAIFAGHHVDADKRVTARARAAMDRHTPTLLAEWSDRGSASTQPVFVFGLPRSGTTLLEQFLASHADVAGLGERDMTGWLSSYLQTLTPDRLRQATQAYVASYPDQARDKRRVIDKSLGSYVDIGLILLMFPNAGLINCLRHPLDVALSAWSQHFAASTLVYTSSFDRLVEHMQLYAELMRHWHKTFPGRILDVRYEDMVAAPDATVRRAVSHLGLEWDPACLRFNETQREVRTASLSQVRQPLYRDSIGRWRAYEHHLGPLQQALAGLADAYDASGNYGWETTTR